MKYIKKYFKPLPGYETKTLSNGTKYLFRLSVIPLVEHIKIIAAANPFNSDNNECFTKRYSVLKLRNNFSY